MEHDQPDNNDEAQSLRRAFQQAQEQTSSNDMGESSDTEAKRPETTSQSVPPVTNVTTHAPDNYVIGKSPFTPKDGDITPDEIKLSTLNFHNLAPQEFEKVDSSQPNIDMARSKPEVLWGTSFVESRKHVLNGNTLVKTLADDSAYWSQKVESDAGAIGPGRPRFSSSQGGVISGERALLKTSAALGLGSMVHIPLWHTGIWVSLKAPSESSLLELERRMAAEKIDLGRATSGMLFSNTGIYTVSYLVNFALQHIYESSLRDISPEHMKSIIKAPDIPILIWGLACTIYPRGYKYARPCTANPVECNHVVHGDLDLGKMFFTNNNALSDRQKNMMARRNDKFTTDELKTYESEHIKGHDRRIDVNDILSVVLKVPTIHEYESSGFKWVDGVVSMLESSLGTSLKGDQRNSYIYEQAKLTALRQYGHWVKEVQVDDDIIEDRETLDLFISTLTANETFSNTFIEAVGQYIDDVVISTIAIPRYTCPACGGGQHADIDDNYHPHLLPLDVVRVFFTLQDQKLHSAITRQQRDF